MKKMCVVTDMWSLSDFKTSCGSLHIDRTAMAEIWADKAQLKLDVRMELLSFKASSPCQSRRQQSSGGTEKISVENQRCVHLFVLISYYSPSLGGTKVTHKPIGLLSVMCMPIFCLVLNLWHLICISYLSVSFSCYARVICTRSIFCVTFWCNSCIFLYNAL